MDFQLEQLNLWFYLSRSSLLILFFSWPLSFKKFNLWVLSFKIITPGFIQLTISCSRSLPILCVLVNYLFQDPDLFFLLILFNLSWSVSFYNPNEFSCSLGSILSFLHTFFSMRSLSQLHTLKYAGRSRTSSDSESRLYQFALFRFSSTTQLND